MSLYHRTPSVKTLGYYHGSSSSLPARGFPRTSSRSSAQPATFRKVSVDLLVPRTLLGMNAPMNFKSAIARAQSPAHESGALPRFSLGPVATFASLTAPAR